MITTVPFGPGINLFLGRNAQGKSNFLEAAYCLGLGRSFRTSREEDVIEFLSNEASVTGDFESPGGSFTLSVSWEKPLHGELKKTIRLNGHPLQKLSEFLDRAPMVMLGHDDLDLVRGSPEGRRKMLDLLCCRVRPALTATLRGYRKILDARNRWLKLPTNRHDPRLREVYNEKLVSLGSEIIMDRIKAVDHLRPRLESLYQEIFDGEASQIRYRTSIKNISGKSPEAVENAFTEVVQSLREKEILRRCTLVGPHRDDFDLKLLGKKMKDFSSFGEIRRAAVILKLAEMEIIREKTGRMPILLIDDSLNELDHEHMVKFFSYLEGKGQVFYATTGYNPLFDPIDGLSNFSVEKGGVFPCSPSGLKAC